MRHAFRPWGDMTWVLDHIQSQRWAFVGAASMEDRCTATVENLLERAAVGSSLIFRIQDAQSRYLNEVELKTDRNEQRIAAMGLAGMTLSRRHLLGRHGAIATDIDEFFNKQPDDSLVIDISSLPKKVFFLLIRKALERPNSLRNIVVTYTEPDSYCKSPLAENPGVWNPLPGFLPPRPEPADKTLIIGLGYEPLGLPELYSSGIFSNANSRLLFPFPASPNSVARNWDFARLLEPVPGNSSQNITLIDALNVPDTFDKLVSITGEGSTYSILAPFGPKPMSLAMCLFASAFSGHPRHPSVFYTQPTIYNPDYSTGVKQKDGQPAITAYCIRLNGNNLYDTPRRGQID